jgi:hypothetical protein
LGLDPLAVDQQFYRLDSGFVWRERSVHVGSPGSCSYLESYLYSQGETVALRRDVCRELVLGLFLEYRCANF